MNKILAFIKNEEGKLLLLKGSDNDPQFHESFWYTVTGAMEPIDNTLMDTVTREVKEETNLEITDIQYLNWILRYTSLGISCEEYVFICKVSKISNIILNEENVEYKWCELNQFIDEIKWYGDKEVLKEVLLAHFDGRKYFNTEETTNM